MAKQKNFQNKWLAWILAAAAVLMVAGCASQASDPPLAAADPPAKSQPQASTAEAAHNDPPPKVQNCAIVTISTPVKYACKGKVYTEFELQRLREKWEESNNK